VYTISKQFHFSASHQLQGLPPGHQCGRLHGHNYQVEVVLQEERLNQHSFVVDYGELFPLKEYIDTRFDHRHLNEVCDFQTTAENLAKHLFDFCKKQWAETVAVKVSETPRTWATYRESLQW